MVNKKRQARRKWQQFRNRADKTILNNKTQILDREIRKIKEVSISSYLQNLTDDKDKNYSLWIATKKIKRPITSVPPIRKDMGSWARDNKQKAKVFAEYK